MLNAHIKERVQTHVDKHIIVIENIRRTTRLVKRKLPYSNTGLNIGLHPIREIHEHTKQRI